MDNDILVKVVKKLPHDVIRYIYTNYLWFDVEKKPLIDNFLYWLNNNENVIRLNIGVNTIKKEICFFQQLLQCDTCRWYLSKKEEYFDRLYKNLIIEKKNTIWEPIKENMGRELIFNLIMCKYH